MAAANAGAANLGGFIVPLVFFAMFYFFAIRPQKKRQKEITEMRESLKVGDQVITIGGIHGKIVKLKDETITIEVGSDKTKFEVTRWAIGSTVD